MLKVYLAGEIHTNWREEIIEKGVFKIFIKQKFR
jgi:hypothetical protein